jgi:hypothetical protein
MRRWIAAIVAVFNAANGLAMPFRQLGQCPDKLRHAPDTAPGERLN